jgi:two-component system chemotaxis response regulator CheB
VLRELLSGAPDIEIVGIARDGLDALEQCATQAPHVLTLDLMMPELDGIGVLKALSQFAAPPRVVVVSSSALDSRIAVEALGLGALSIVQKPTALATQRMYEMGEELIRQVRLAAASAAPRPAPVEAPALALETGTGRARVIVVGTSTGGPQALTHLLSALPAELPVPVAAVVHIPAGYTASLAERINRFSALTVVEAAEGLQIDPGMAVIARAGIHLKLKRVGERTARCELSPEPLGHLHRPAVDVLLSSAADAFGSGVLALVLTGMGEDGLKGALAVRTAGGEVLTEHPSSSIIDGMPRAVREAGLSDAEVTLTALSSAIAARC